MEEKTVEIIPIGKIIKVEFPTEMIGSLRTGLEAERELRKNLSDAEFSELVVKLCRFDKECEIKDYSFKMLLYFIARLETQCKNDNIYEKITKSEYQQKVKDATPNP
jgi:hypothetical protein